MKEPMAYLKRQTVPPVSGFATRYDGNGFVHGKPIKRQLPRQSCCVGIFGGVFLNRSEHTDQDA